MTDFLSSLVERTFGAAPAIRPRVASLFEPALPRGEAALDRSLLPVETSSEPTDSEHGPAGRGPQRPESFRRDNAAEAGTVALRLPAEVRRPIAASTQLRDLRPRAPERRSVSPLLPESTRAAAEQPATDRSRSEPDSRAIRPDERPTLEWRDPGSAATMADATRFEPAGMAARPKAVRPDDRGLLVPSEPAAAIAADLQRSVTGEMPRRWAAADRRTTRPDRPPTERHVHVTIGRVEVRAAAGHRAPAPERPTSPVMGLDEYLNRQARRGRP